MWNMFKVYYEDTRMVSTTKNVNYWLGYRNKHDAAMQETYIHTITIFHILKTTYFCMNFLFFVLNYTSKKIVFVGVFYSAFLTIQL